VFVGGEVDGLFSSREYIDGATTSGRKIPKTEKQLNVKMGFKTGEDSS